MYLVFSKNILQVRSALLAIVEDNSFVVLFDFRIIDYNKFIVFDIIGLRVGCQYSFLVSIAFELEHFVHRTINVARQSTCLDVLFRLLIKSM
jgi:hypothetical protein